MRLININKHQNGTYYILTPRTHKSISYTTSKARPKPDKAQARQGKARQTTPLFAYLTPSTSPLSSHLTITLTPHYYPHTSPSYMYLHSSMHYIIIQYSYN